MYLNKQFDIIKNSGEETIKANVQIEGDGNFFRITLRPQGNSSMGIKFVLDESEVHSFAKMFDELSEDAKNGYPEQYEPTIED